MTLGGFCRNTRVPLPPNNHGGFLFDSTHALIIRISPHPPLSSPTRRLRKCHASSLFLFFSSFFGFSVGPVFWSFPFSKRTSRSLWFLLLTAVPCFPVRTQTWTTGRSQRPRPPPRPPRGSRPSAPTSLRRTPGRPRRAELRVWEGGRVSRTTQVYPRRCVQGLEGCGECGQCSELSVQLPPSLKIHVSSIKSVPFRWSQTIQQNQGSLENILNLSLMPCTTTSFVNSLQFYTRRLKTRHCLKQKLLKQHVRVEENHVDSTCAMFNE